MPQSKLPALVGVTPNNIPARLTSSKRWAVWVAVWSEKRQKYDKVPKHPASGYGISTMRPEKWCDYETALGALRNSAFAGVGYLMTGSDGLVGIDMDKCVVDGVVAPWAQAIVDQVGSYAEISPSGNGVRIFAEGAIAFDWTNHGVGIEVYAGHTARFLTVTGAHLEGTPKSVKAAPAGALASLAARHAKERESATVISMSMPDIADPLALPDLSDLGLPYKVMDYLNDGTPPSSDRSLALFTTATALHSAGLDTETVFSILANNEFTMGDALGKRHQDVERALLYLWVHHAQKSKDRATSPTATLADFEDVSSRTVADDFEDVSGQGASPVAAPKKRFAFTTMSELEKRPAAEWLIRNVFPHCEVGAVFGESGAGKSFFVLDMVLAIARGVDWNGKRVKQGNVAYVVAEGGGRFHWRTSAYAKHNKAEVRTLAAFQVLADAPSLLDMKDVKDLASALVDIPNLKVVVLDTLAQVTPGANENSAEDMGRALASAKRIHRVTGATVLIVAHTGKDTSRGLRGWSGIKAALDFEIHVERSGGYRSATITKMKDGGGEGDEHPFKLGMVDLGFKECDEDEVNVQSCVVVPGDAGDKPERGAAGLRENQRAVMDAVTGAGANASRDGVLDTATETIKANCKPGQREKARDRAREALNAMVKNGKLNEVNGAISVPNQTPETPRFTRFGGFGGFA